MLWNVYKIVTIIKNRNKKNEDQLKIAQGKNTVKPNKIASAIP